MSFHVVRQHFADHRLHLAGCLAAMALVLLAAVIGAPVLAVLGGLMCGAMMLMMVWMMVGMARRHHG